MQFAFISMTKIVSRFLLVNTIEIVKTIAEVFPIKNQNWIGVNNCHVLQKNLNLLVNEQSLFSFHRPNQYCVSSSVMRVFGFNNKIQVLASFFGT